MNKELYVRRIEQLTDDKLKELLQLKNEWNNEIMSLAEAEAMKRRIDIDAIERKRNQTLVNSSRDDRVRWMSLLAEILSDVD